MADSSDSESSERGYADALLEYDEPGDYEPAGPDQLGMTVEEATFDPVLTTQHTYLGHGEEVSGRTVLEEGSTLELPLLYDSAVMLIPGQTLPLTLFHPAAVAMVRRAIAHNKTFGFINENCVRPDGSSEPTIGTTAEIYEVRDESQDAYTAFSIKAKGRQRFRLVSTRTTVDGTRVGTVHILADVLPAGPFALSRPGSLWRQRLSASPRHSGREAAVAGWPAWLYQMYDVQRVAARAHADARRCLLCSAEAVPTDPVKLSYWVAMNLPIDDTYRAMLMRLDSVVRRLRCEISIMQSFNVMHCAECDQPVASSDEMFAMSADGPQSIFVNPNGHLHETLTLRRATGLRCITRPSAEFCWFPGYLWEIAQCVRCSQHMGWRFTAGSAELRPHSFWAVCRRSLAAKRTAALGPGRRGARPPPAGAGPSRHALSRLVL
ncbi:protein cereblon-like [Amphibalanus amphitrite]|uniref:protein cereblon-like n=1 Tax=Amphibalanus amphitrite TaxID=1232801 RepID=UPI001C9274ED|nr:protein cereblon-like [Amphibalanus amphitrite]